MKISKLAQKIILTLGISAITASSLFAETIDVSKSLKDIKVMTRIIEASLESSDKSFPGRPRIKGTYLARQGYLFNIQLNGISSFGIPGIASWDSGRLELDIPEIVSNALASVDYGDAISHDFDVDDEAIVDMVDPVMDSLEGLYDNEELQETLRNLREKQRDVRRETYQIRRDIRKSEDEKQRKELEQKLDKNRETLKQYSKEYSGTLNTYKTERKARQVIKSSNAIDAVFGTLCDYGQSLKALKKNEMFTLMIRGGVDSDGNKTTQVFVIKQKALTNCDNSKKLRSNALHYNL